MYASGKIVTRIRIYFVMLQNTLISVTLDAQGIMPGQDRNARVASSTLNLDQVPMKLWKIERWGHLNYNLFTVGSPTSLEVLRCSGKYVKKDTVILKLRENGSNYRFLIMSITTLKSIPFSVLLTPPETIFWHPSHWLDGLHEAGRCQGERDCLLQEGEVWSWQEGSYYCQEQWWVNIWFGIWIGFAFSGIWSKKSEGYIIKFCFFTISIFSVLCMVYL